MTTPRFFAVTPAAGHSRRMGEPKLMKVWKGKPLIAHLLAAWQSAGVSATIVVARQTDGALAELCEQCGAMVVQPELDPPDMKASVAEGLQKIRQDWAPADEDYWLLAPADMPLLSGNAIRRVMDGALAHPGRIVAPVFGQARGHPVAFPWHFAAAIPSLAADQGLNALVRRHSLVELELDDRGILDDVDTPEDFGRLP